jgi:hypothetical protein
MVAKILRLSLSEVAGLGDAVVFAERDKEREREKRKNKTLAKVKQNDRD